MYSDSKGTDKTTSNKTFQTKNSGQNPPRTKTYVCMHVLLKIGGPRCVLYFRGGPEMCDKV